MATFGSSNKTSSKEQKMNQKVAIVTGANKGIGFEVCRQLAKKKIEVILTSRSSELGKAALKKLKDEGLSVSYCQLDVTDPQSIDVAYDYVKKEFGHLEILINNAGIAIDSKRNDWGDKEEVSIFHTNLDVIRKTMETNTYGPLRMIQKFGPLMKTRGYGRIVNLSSGMGQLSEMNGGWAAYRISKTALNAITRIAADELSGADILVNSACPGWVKTDMGGSEANLTPEQGADTIVWLATLPSGGPTGGFFRERERIEW